MTVKKRYCSSSQFDIFLELEDKKNVHIVFAGRDVIKKEYFVDVTDPEIQKALESNKFFNYYYYKSDEFVWTEIQVDPVIKITVEQTETVEPQLPEDGPITETQETTPQVDIQVNEPVEPFNPEVIEKEFPTVKEAKYWLNSTFHVPFNKLSNKQMLENEFSALGMKLKLTS